MEVLPLSAPSLGEPHAALYLPLTPISLPQSFQKFEKPGVEPTYHVEEPLYPLPPKPRLNQVLVEDLKTPDNHVERDPRLIRLTGVHPFNVEAPLSELYDEGFLTTKDLHYVRNHGAVPRVEDEDVLDWEFSVEGMVQHPIKMTLRELIQEYEQVTYPITLVCAGNRRKEQNVVRKSKGFSWGPAGLSTALWTGVTLPELLARAVPKRGARYVCFEGADKLPNGYYGTSVKLNWATDPDRGIMLAHKMNGEPLPPDHGRPLRMVIPGQIGGRSVKWLKRIIVTSKPSDNWYHIYDNRVLPTTISPEESADLPETWRDERYAIYDLNTNSAICYPAHDEKVSLTGSAESYKLKGYAYAGGGKRVSRLEVTLDQGRTWILANISYPEDQYRLAPEGESLFGGRLDMSWRETCFCWCFFELDIPLSRLQAAGDVMIRAMDDSMMVQPRDMYWSVLGMMNNPWYRVVIHKEGHTLRFEHPTQPALMPGGWMERVKKEGGNLSNGFWGEKTSSDAMSPIQEEPAKVISMVNDKITRQITSEELRQHEGEDEPWFVVNGQVYDGTPFLEGHPGGAASITIAAGQDVSEEFLAIRKLSPTPTPKPKRKEKETSH
jgi:nitrate reductase (NAD(P)H)